MAVAATAPSGDDMSEAVAAIDVPLVEALLAAGGDPNAVRAPGGEEPYQPDRPLKMVMFRLSDCMVGPDDRAKLARIARALLDHGADPGPAMEIAEARYGEYPWPDGVDGNRVVWEAWSIVAAAAAAAGADATADVAAAGHTAKPPRPPPPAAGR
jgi:hypothetical protein